MARNKKYAHTLSAQLMAWIAAAALISGAVFGALFGLGQLFVDRVIDTPDFQREEFSRKLSQFQGYVTKNNVAAVNYTAIHDWVDDQSSIFLEVYRGRRILYSSVFAGGGPGEQLMDVDWHEVLVHSALFADGPAEVFIYYDVPYGYRTALLIAEIIMSVAVFILLVLRWSKRLIAYIGVLSGEIQAMAGGDFDGPVTVRGQNELSALAENLDEMRMAFLRQREQETAYHAANQALITQMSHDLRTPLTTLLLYTEILKYKKYQGEDQLADYLDRVDGKARQIKDLADNIFRYSLHAAGQADDPAPDREPAPMETVFAPALAEAVHQLEQAGFTVKSQLCWPAGAMADAAYGRRILDNVTSNILKYGDPARPVDIAVTDEAAYGAMCFKNTMRRGDKPADSSGVGLSSVRAMMEKQSGSCHVEQTEDTFTLTLLFSKE